MSSTVNGPRTVTVFFILRKVVWSLALIAMVFLALDGFFSFVIQKGAPQQAASAASSCFELLSVYVIARALDQLLREPDALG